MANTPRTVELDAFYVIGIATRTSNQREADAATASIPLLWQRFFEENVMQHVPSRVSTKVCFGVYNDYEGGEAGDYTVVAGVEVSSLQNVPEGMTGVKVPASRYTVFDAHGELPAAILDGWHEVWTFFGTDATYARTFQADFEIYDVTKKNHAEIYISIA